jgi:DNA uptake protein ComE-like DNA-binding protein
LKALEALPGIGAKRAARIVRHRPFANLAELAAALDDAAVVEGVRSFVGLSS